MGGLLPVSNWLGFGKKHGADRESERPLLSSEVFTQKLYLYMLIMIHHVQKLF
jgi:hypothetical protein